MKKMVRTSIIFRLLICVILVILPMNVLMIICSQLLANASREQIQTEAKNVLSVYMDKMDRELDDAERFLLNIKLDEAYLKLLDAKKSEREQLPFVTAQLRVIYKMEDFLESRDLISGIVISYENSEIYLARDRTAAMDANIKSAIRDGISANKRWQIQMHGAEWYLLRCISYGQSHIYMWMRLNDTVRYFRENETGTQNLYLKNNEADGLLADVVDGRVHSYVDESASLKENKHLYMSVASENVPLTIGRWLSEDVYTILPLVTRFMEVMSVIALLAIPVLIWQLRRQVIKPVAGLTSAICRIQGGDMDYRIQGHAGNNEFEQINASFNRMMDEINVLKVDVYEEKIEKQKIRLEYLSHQVQPHFILNTLNILYCYGPEDYPLIQKMIKLLMKYFRYIVKADSYFVTIEQELSHIRNYMDIQLARYPDNFYYYVECEPGAEHCLLPPLIIQNFVENAIKNALNLDKYIHIYVLVENIGDEKIRIRIADTGDGFGAKILKEIEVFQQTHVSQPHLGVGLQNAILRLEMLYGGLPELKIYNSLAGGATVDILLPRHMGVEEDV